MKLFYQCRHNLLMKLLFGMCLFIVSLFINMGRENVQASTEYKAINTHLTFEIQDRTVGETTFESANDVLYAVKDGKKILLASEKGLSSIILANGTEVYYSVDDFNNDSSTIYHIDSVGEKGKKLFSVKKIENMFYLAGLYGGKVYYVKGIDPGTFCSYTIRTNKKKIIKRNVTSAHQCKQYFYLMPYSGGVLAGGVWLRVYNAKNDKVKLISKRQICYSVISDHLYYAEIKAIRQKELGGCLNIELKKCSLDGSSKIILIKSLNVKNIIQIDDHSLIYVGVNGKHKTKKF